MSLRQYLSAAVVAVLFVGASPAQAGTDPARPGLRPPEVGNVPPEVRAFPARASARQRWNCSATSPEVDLRRLRAAFSRINAVLPTVGISLIAQPAEDDDADGPAVGEEPQKPTTISCGSRANRRVVSASTIKPLLVAELFHQRQRADRWPTLKERRLARAAIRYSDNGATSAIWRRTYGHGGLVRFARQAGLPLNAGYGTKWGLTRLSAATLSNFSMMLLHPTAPVTPEGAAFVRRSMERVISRQRWGISAGAPSGSTIALKPGWLPFYRNQHVHSFGIIEARKATYALSVVSTGSRSFGQGIARIERAARLANRALRRTTFPAPAPPPEPDPTPKPSAPPATKAPE